MDGFVTTGGGFPWIRKDPNADLDYQLDWSAWLKKAGNDTLATVVWTIPAGLTKDSEAHTTTTATIWLSGGVVGTSYTVTCSITTANGREDDRSFNVIVGQR